MAKKYCKDGPSVNKEGKKRKYICNKCGFRAVKDKNLCKPVKYSKSA